MVQINNQMTTILTAIIEMQEKENISSEFPFRLQFPVFFAKLIQTFEF